MLTRGCIHITATALPRIVRTPFFKVINDFENLKDLTFELNER
jgi:hypothetical protein